MPPAKAPQSGEARPAREWPEKAEMLIVSGLCSVGSPSCQNAIMHCKSPRRTPRLRSAVAEPSDGAPELLEQLERAVQRHGTKIAALFTVSVTSPDCRCPNSSRALFSVPC